MYTKDDEGESTMVSQEKLTSVNDDTNFMNTLITGDES